MHQSTIQYISETLGELESGKLLFSNTKRMSLLDLENYAQAITQEKLFNKIMDWRKYVLSALPPTKYQELTDSLYAEIIQARATGLLIPSSLHNDEQVNKLEKNVKNIKADLRKLLIAMNMQPTEEDDENGVSQTPPSAQPPKQDYRGVF